MQPIPISLQLYSLRKEAAKDFPAVLKSVADMGYVGVEFAGYHGMAPADIKTILDELGLVASSTHGGFPDEGNVGRTVEEAKLFGYTRHIAGFGPDDCATLETTLAAAARAQAAAELLEGTGVTFGLHNHWWEFDKDFDPSRASGSFKMPNDGKSPHEVLMEKAPDVFAEVDTYWVAVGGGDAADVVEKLGARAPVLHIKDGPMVKDKAMTAVGAGKMDWEAVIDAASDSTEWLVVELDSCDTDMTEAVAESCRYLTSKGCARGRE